MGPGALDLAGLKSSFTHNSFPLLQVFCGKKGGWESPFDRLSSSNLGKLAKNKKHTSCDSTLAMHEASFSRFFFERERHFWFDTQPLKAVLEKGTDEVQRPSRFIAHKKEVILIIKRLFCQIISPLPADSTVFPKRCLNFRYYCPL